MMIQRQWGETSIIRFIVGGKYTKILSWLSITRIKFTDNWKSSKLRQIRRKAAIFEKGEHQVYLAAFLQPTFPLSPLVFLVSSCCTCWTLHYFSFFVHFICYYLSPSREEEKSRNQSVFQLQSLYSLRFNPFQKILFCRSGAQHNQIGIIKSPIIFSTIFIEIK